MSSGNLYSDIFIRQADGLPDQLNLGSFTFLQSQDLSHILLQEETPFFSTAPSNVTNIDCDSFDVWNYNNVVHDGQYGNDITPTTNISETRSTNAFAYSAQGCPTQMFSGIPLKVCTINQDLTARHPPTAFHPFTQHSSPSLDSNMTGPRVQHSASPPQYHLHHGYNNIASQPTFNNTTTSRSGQALKSTPKPKIHHCPRCERTFARPADLQRHIDGVHLRIRHHCHALGCGNNHGRGYCRLEKLRKHVLDVHGRF